jgi:hypothetical protein
MCADPVTIAMSAFQAVKGISEHNAAVDRANAQNQMYLQNAANAREAQLNDVRAYNRRQDQEAQAKAQKDLELTLEGAQKQATVQTAAGEAGIAGKGVQLILDNYERQQSVAQGTVARNFDAVREQIAAEKEGTKYTFQSRVNSVSKGYAPSALQSGLGIAANVGTTLYGDPGVKKAFNNTFSDAKGIFNTASKYGTNVGSSQTAMLWDQDKYFL